MIKIISNPSSLFGTLFSFLGTLILIIDNFDLGHELFNNFNQFGNIEIGLNDLRRNDTTFWGITPGGSLNKYDRGFSELSGIICENFRTIEKDSISQLWILKYSGDTEDILGIVLNNGKVFDNIPDYLFYDWTIKFREKIILCWGITLIIIGFFLIIHSHINYKYIYQMYS